MSAKGMYPHTALKRLLREFPALLADYKHLAPATDKSRAARIQRLRELYIAATGKDIPEAIQ